MEEEQIFTLLYIHIFGFKISVFRDKKNTIIFLLTVRLDIIQDFGSENNEHYILKKMSVLACGRSCRYLSLFLECVSMKGI